MTTASTTPHVAFTKETFATLTLYECLGCDDLNALNSIDEKELQRRFRRRSLQVHPDKDPSPEARAAFERLKLAVETLVDPQRRMEYLNGLKRVGGSAATRERDVATENMVRAAADALHQREREVVRRLAEAQEAKRRVADAAASMVRDLTTSRSSFRDIEDALVREWDVDAEMVSHKEREVLRLLAALRDSGFGKRPRAAAFNDEVPA